MPTYTLSTNMSLPVPIVGTTPGPDYATDLNACLTLVDQHDHSSGYGVQITPSGLNINSNLTLNSNNAISIRSLRFTAQSSPLALSSDLGCLYESGVDLYYNDGSGNQVRLTQSGGVAGTSGSIASLASPASATYVSGNATFVWQSAANTAANMDGGSVIIRETVASANGVTISSPASLASNYTLTLPTSLPASKFFMAVDASGNISSLVATAGGLTTANISASAGIVGTQLASGTITGTQVSSSAALSVASVAASGTVSAATVTGTTVNATSLVATSATVGGYIPAVATVSSSPLGIYQGRISAAGAITSGEGFTVSHPGTGSYVITWTGAGWNATPSIQATLDNGATSGHISIDITTYGNAGCGVFTYDLAGVATNYNFTLLAIGHRA